VGPAVASGYETLICIVPKAVFSLHLDTYFRHGRATAHLVLRAPSPEEERTHGPTVTSDPHTFLARPLSMSDSRPPVKYELALLLVVLIWGVNFPLVKYALAFVRPLTFNAFRFSISVAFLAIMLYRERRRTGRRARSSRGRWMGLVGLGLLGHFAYQVFFILGLDLTTAGLCAFLISTSPIWTATVATIMGNDRLVPRAWLGLSVAFIGASTLIFGRTGIDFADSTLLGNAVSFLAAIAWGSFTAMSRRYLDEHTPISLAFWTMFVALPFLWAVAILEPDTFIGMERPIVWLILAYSGVLSTGVAYIFWNVGIRHVGPAHTAVFANLVPVIAFIIGMLWLGETGTAYEVAGALSILFGLYVMRRSRVVPKGAAPAGVTR